MVFQCGLQSRRIFLGNNKIYGVVYTMNKRQLAKALGVSLSTVDKWLLKQDFPSKKVGNKYYFDIEEVKNWLKKREKEREKLNTLSKEKAKLIRANAQLKELQLKKLKGELIEKQVAFEAFAFTLTRMRDKLIAIPNKSAPLLITAKSLQEIKQILEDLIREVLNEISSEEFVFECVYDYGVTKGLIKETKASSKVKRIN